MSKYSKQSYELSDSPDSADSNTWYRGGLAFECTQCGKCCSGPETGYVWVTEEEIEALAKAMGIESTDEFERKFVRRVGRRYSLVEYSDGDCILLDPKTRTCLAYEARPIQCRTWPFWRENVDTPKSWAETAAACPGCNRGKLYSVEHIQATIRTTST